VLSGETIELREWREADLDAIAALRNDIALQTLLMSQPRPNSLERVRTWLSSWAERADAVLFVIVGRADDAVLGYVQVANIDTFHGHGELGICLSRDAHGKNLARDACDLLEAYLVKTLVLRKLTLKVLASNQRAIGFYRKYGYRDVGVLERHYRAADVCHDVLVMERHLSS
jgi:RimJ/RimL family protein N-acetyltransferase